MRTTIDGENIQVTGTTLADALEAGTAAAQDRGRVLIEVAVDGHHVEGELLEAMLADPPSPAEVTLRTADPELLLRETFYDAVDALESIDGELTACATQIQGGQVAAALEQLHELLDTWQAVRTALECGAELLDRPLDALVPGHDLHERVQGLARCLTELRSAMVAEDLASLADLCEYDMREEGQLWRTALRGAASELGKSDDAPPA